MLVCCYFKVSYMLVLKEHVTMKLIACTRVTIRPKRQVCNISLCGSSRQLLKLLCYLSNAVVRDTSSRGHYDFK